MIISYIRRRITLSNWRKAIKIGDKVKVKVSKSTCLELKVVLQPRNNEVDVFNPNTLNYESYKLSKIFPTDMPCK